MRPSPRVVAFAIVGLMLLPLLPAELLEAADTAAAQGDPLRDLLPQGVLWQDWQASHKVLAKDVAETACPRHPQTNQPTTPSERNCPLPLDTKSVPTGVPKRRARATVPGSDLPQQEGGQLNVEDVNRVWMRLEPGVKHPMRVTSLRAEIYIQFASLTPCDGLTEATGRIDVGFEVAVLPAGENFAGGVIGTRKLDGYCPYRTGENPPVIHQISADIPLNAPVTLLPDQKLQFSVAIQRDVPGEWTLEYATQTAQTGLIINSPDAFQFATWMEDRDRKVTTIFPVPTGPGDRLSSVGFFGFKTAFGGYDNPPATSNPPLANDSKWAMNILDPAGNLVVLRDPALNPTPNEFKDCEGQSTDTKTCLDQAAISTDSPPSARVFRMPARPLLPGSSDVWNYTQQRINEISPGGGEFILQMTGGVRGNPISSRLGEGVRFTVGGFGVRLAPLKAGLAEESTSHTVRPGQPTTFLINITNIAPKADNFTLSTEFQTCAPSNIPCSQWGVAFSGRDVRGQNVASLQGANSSLLKVTVTPPANALAANLKVRAQSQSAPDQRNETQLNVQVSSTLVRGTGIFLFPDLAEKHLRRGERQTFNYTVWNRGTDSDSFSVSCDQGPDPNFNSQTRQRNDDSWNGTIQLGGTVIGCRDIDPVRKLSATIPPGDTREATVTVEATANATARPQITIVVKAQSQGDLDRSDSATARALLETRRSIKLLILTDGTANPDDPFSTVQAKQTLRFGKDDSTVCPSPANPGTTACGSDNTENTLTDNPNLPVSQQRLDLNFTEFAYYRIQLVNDGDEEGLFNVRVAEVKNTTLDNCGGDNSFDLVRENNTFAMKDTEGVLLLHRPVYYWPVLPTDKADTLRVPAGKSASFYLRVHHEWNRLNISRLNAADAINIDGAICNGESRVTVQASGTGFPPQSVIATTTAIQAPVDDPVFRKSVVVTQGARQEGGIYEGDFPQTCPPVTAPDSGDRVLCKYIRPGQILPGCSCSVSWFFTANKFWGIGDDFADKPLRRVGGLSLTDLVNRGWRFAGPMRVDDALGKGNLTLASGDEVKYRVDVTVPANATINDFAGLQLEVGTRKAGVSQFLSFYTVGAQKFKVNVSNLAGAAAIEIHPGDRAAINLNISNEGAGVDVYNLTVVGNLPTGYVPSFQPEVVRLAPSRNKTATVFIASPAVGQFPQTVQGLIRVESQVNLSRLKGETFVEVPFTVLVRERIADNVDLKLQGLQTRPISGGGSLLFSLNVSNPAPNEKPFVLRRLPAQDLVREFVNGWTDFVGESCFTVPARGEKQVSFTINAPTDALQDTHVTYVLRVDEANNAQACQPRTDNPNFAQGLVTATVIGAVGLEVQALDPVKVVPRGGNVSLPIRIRNVGTADDVFQFQARFNNESQALPPNPWSAEVRNSAGQPISSLSVAAQSGPIVFVNVHAPLDIPFTGVRNDLELSVRGSNATSALARLTVFVQDYDIRLRIANNTVDAAPGQSLFFTLNMTNAGNGIDTHDIFVDIGGLQGFWNVTSEFSAVTLLNGTSKDILLTVQVPKSPLPTTGAVIGVTVRSRQVETLRPSAEALGAGSPLVSLLNQVPKSALVSVNLFPYVSLDVDGDREPELAIDRNRNALDGFETFNDPFAAVVQSINLLAADGDGDGRLDHFLDIDVDGRPERYWDPDDGRLTAIGGSIGGGAANEAYPDVDNDGTLEYLYDSDADLAIDQWIDPSTRRTGAVIEKDFDDDGNPEWLIDTNGDDRPDKYFDADRGPRGLVTTVEAAPGGNPQQYAIDTTGQGRPTKVYDRVTGEVTTASFSSVGAFFTDYWYLVLLFLAVAVLAGYLVWQQRKGPGQKPPQQP